MSNMPFDTQLLSAYASSRIVLEGPRAVQLAGPDAIENWPFAGHLTVLTAANPRSLRLSDDDNDLRNVALLGGLKDDGHHVVAVTAGLHDWYEPSFGVLDLPPETAREWAADFGQHAWYELTADEVRVIATESGDVVDSRPRRHDRLGVRWWAMNLARNLRPGHRHTA